MNILEFLGHAREVTGQEACETANGWDLVCPVPDHNDQDPSLGVARGRDGRVLVNCRAGCTAEEVVRALGLTIGDLFSNTSAERSYPYVDGFGELLFDVLRKSGKQFRQRRPDGRGGWTWDRKGVPAVLYRLPAVLDAVKAGRPVWIAEGEKDVEALELAGVTATCNPGGAGKWEARFADVLAGADVVIVADRDQAGYAHAADVARSLAGKARSVRVVEAAEGNDAFDHLATGLDLDDFREVQLGAGYDVIAEVDDDWHHQAAAVEYPVEMLPGVRELVAATPSLPAPLVGGAALAALAALAAPARLEVADGWTVAPGLWVPLLGPAGVGKSPALLRAFDPVWPHAHVADRLVDDFTMEALVRRLDSTSGQAAVVADELAALLGSLGRYRGSADGGDRARFLALWNGAPWRYQRVTKNIDLLVPEPVVVVTGGLVLERHHLLGPAGDGMRPRWLPHLATSIGDDDLETRGGGDGGWAELVDCLAGEVQDRTWTLDGAPRAAWSEARKRWRALAFGDEPETIQAFAPKADTHAAKVALVLAEVLDPGRGGPIPAEAVAGAVALVDYAVDVWRQLGGAETLALSRVDQVRDEAVEKLLAWFTRTGRTSANRRTLSRSAVAGIRTADDLDAVLERYSARYPGHVRKGGTPPGGGPKPLIVYAPGQAPRSG